MSLEPIDSLQRRVALVFLALLVCVMLALWGLGSPLIEQFLPIAALSGVAWVMVWLLVHRNLDAHPHVHFGPANVITSVRAAMTLLLTACLPAIGTLQKEVDVQSFWLLSAIAAVALLLDGLDGKLARSSGLSSSFGARYDMETDALLGLIITLLVWRSGELGVWVLGLGVMRYLFLLVGVFQPALQGELYPSFRRKFVCVVQVGVLSVLLTPVVEPPWSTMLAAVALLMLAGSFIRDVLWLLSSTGSHDT